MSSLDTPSVTGHSVRHVRAGGIKSLFGATSREYATIAPLPRHLKEPMADHPPEQNCLDLYKITDRCPLSQSFEGVL